MNEKNQNESIVFEKELSRLIIKCAFEVFNRLGYGFLEKVYENSLIFELKENGIRAEQQVPLKVYYKNKIVGEYKADILVDGKIILELKAEKYLNKEHASQLLNYLKASQIKIGYLINFGLKGVEFKRYVF
jgi:GxxExxY protein